jgi:predicted SPOUT superfamily RNA methylase MTH1
MHNTYVHIARIHSVYNAREVMLIRLPQTTRSGRKEGEQIYRLLQFIVGTSTLDSVLLYGRR